MIHYQYLKELKWKIYRFALKTGIRSLIKMNYSIGIKQLLSPVGYWRFPIFPMIIDVTCNGARNKILDLGSPKLLSLYLTLECGHTVYATDIQDEQIFDRYQKHYNDLISPLNDNNYIVELQDARKLTYPDEYFDFVYSISVIEHIPDDGDSTAISEIERVLKPGGKAIVEVPFAFKEYDTYVDKHVYERDYIGGPVFYQRHYDEITLLSRLINPSYMKYLDKFIVAEKTPFEKYYNKVPLTLKAPILWTMPLISHMNHHIITEKETIIAKDHKDCAMSVTLILQKTY